MDPWKIYFHLFILVLIEVILKIQKKKKNLTHK